MSRLVSVGAIPGGLALMVAHLCACGETNRPTLSLQVFTPADSQPDGGGDPQADPFATAVQVTLQVGSRGVPVAAPAAQKQLTQTGIDLSTVSGPVVVRGFDAHGTLVAYGSTPPLDYLPARFNLAVFVQRPGSLGLLGPGITGANPMADHFAVSTIAPAGQFSASSTVVYGSGVASETVEGAANQVLPTGYVYHFDPFALSAVNSGVTPSTGPARFATAATALGTSGTVLCFGGLFSPARPADASQTWASGGLGELALQRSELTYGFSLTERTDGIFATATQTQVARGRAAMVAVGALGYAFGGEGDVTAGDDVVRIDPSATDPAAAFTLLPTKMAGPRVSPTATLVTHVEGLNQTPEVLVFGGAAAGVAVAEVFVPGTGFLAPAGDPGPPRWDHAAVPLPDGRVLIVGGVDPNGTELASSVIYDPNTRALSIGGVNLVHARSRTAAFVAGNDLVVAAGLAGGAAIHDAEVFDVGTFAPAGAISALPRWGATASALPNHTVILIGGYAPDPTAEIELYLPREPQP